MAARTARGRSFVGEAFPIRLSDLERQADGSVISPIQLARVGTWEHPKYGTLEFTVEKFERYIANFDANVRKVELHIDIGHDGDLKGAAGWFVPGTMRVEDTPDGPGLFVNAKWTRKGIDLVRDEEYKYISPTYKDAWEDPETGKVYQDVMFGAAITIDPFLKGMQTIQEGLPTIMLSECVRLDDSPAQSPSDSVRSQGLHPDAYLRTTKRKEGASMATKSSKDKMPVDTMDGEASDSSQGDKVVPNKRLPVAGKTEREEEDKETAELDDGESLSEDPKKVKSRLKKTQAKEKAEEDEAEGEEDDAIDALDGEEMSEAKMCADLDSLAQQHHDLTKKIASHPALKGKKGMPLVRQHLSASQKLLSMSIPKQEEEEKKMSAQAAGQDVVKLTERLKALEEENRRVKLSATQMRTERRKDQVIKLTEPLFPQKGVPTFKLAATQKDAVQAFALKLSEMDDCANDVIRLSENGADESTHSKLLSEFMGILDGVPENRIKLASTGLDSKFGPVSELSDRDHFNAEAKKLSEEKSIPFHEAATMLSARMAATQL